MGRVETLDLRTIIDFAWRCTVCGAMPQVPQGITTMPELWKHVSARGWTREGYVYRCPRHPINNRAWCRTSIWWGGKSKWFHEDDEQEVYRV